MYGAVRWKQPIVRCAATDCGAAWKDPVPNLDQNLALSGQAHRDVPHPSQQARASTPLFAAFLRPPRAPRGKLSGVENRRQSRKHDFHLLNLHLPFAILSCCPLPSTPAWPSGSSNPVTRSRSVTDHIVRSNSGVAAASRIVIVSLPRFLVCPPTGPVPSPKQPTNCSAQPFGKSVEAIAIALSFTVAIAIAIASYSPDPATPGDSIGCDTGQNLSSVTLSSAPACAEEPCRGNLNQQHWDPGNWRRLAPASSERRATSAEHT
ncbi:hypothetical protein QBC42DRAFT_284712 [Cladorrhinum samala]|uniref:Uncharacterized protein n=1 Tax=Cladorrhinum samala TaxID=585594 RepID=A0AAV9HXC8_9PEZI|nr:hypothetical protein QBC42DRAFT_284712 [Cladorrhinum samala]